jgi:putative ABC transport system ATP-binding protein
MRISTADAAVRYPGFTLGPLTIELEPGLTVLVGPSGAGKSTLLAILAGLRPPHEGTVLYNGRNLAAISDRERARLRKRTVSIALQNPLFLDEVDLVANLRRAAELRGERTNDAEGWLDTLGLSDRLRNTPAALSGGELSRAATARALASACPVILLDEPTAMLDEENAKRVRDAIIGAAAGYSRPGSESSPPIDAPAWSEPVEAQAAAEPNLVLRKAKTPLQNGPARPEFLEGRVQIGGLLMVRQDRHERSYHSATVSRDERFQSATDCKPRAVLAATHDEALIAAADRRWRIRDGRLL